jgi:hypothetical protein
MPCLPQQRPERPEKPEKPERPKIELMTLHQEIWRKILVQLEAIDLATLCQVTKELQQEICSKRSGSLEKGQTHATTVTWNRNDITGDDGSQ